MKTWFFPKLIVNVKATVENKRLFGLCCLSPVMQVLNSCSHRYVSHLQRKSNSRGGEHRDQECGSPRVRLKYCTSVAQLENSWILACHVQYMQDVFPRSAGNNSSISPQGSIKCLKWGHGNYRMEILRCLWFFFFFFDTVFLVCFLPRQHLKSSEAKSSHIIMLCSIMHLHHDTIMCFRTLLHCFSLQVGI